VTEWQAFVTSRLKVVTKLDIALRKGQTDRAIVIGPISPIGPIGPIGHSTEVFQVLPAAYLDDCGRESIGSRLAE